jgi:acyl-CoA thioester hydrolase
MHEFSDRLKERAAYKFWVKDHVRFTDLDALGHVSAVRVHEYFNGVRATLFHQTIEHWPWSDQLPVLKLSIIVHEQEVRFPDMIDVGVTIEKFGKTSVTFVLGIFNKNGFLALSRNVFVFIDGQTRGPVIPLDSTREAFLRLAG